MSSYLNRLDRLEQVIRPRGIPDFRYTALVDYDERGNCAELALYDRGHVLVEMFTPAPDESEDALRERAFATVGSPEDRIVICYVRAGPNGGLAPGFERFAK